MCVHSVNKHRGRSVIGGFTHRGSQQGIPGRANSLFHLRQTEAQGTRETHPGLVCRSRLVFLSSVALAVTSASKSQAALGPAPTDGPERLPRCCAPCDPEIPRSFTVTVLDVYNQSGARAGPRCYPRRLSPKQRSARHSFPSIVLLTAAGAGVPLKSLL